MKPRFDPEILSLIPHREPMLLINELLSLSAQRAESLVLIDDQTPFCSEKGVPSWIGLEYMGQTSALIAGFQEREGLCEPHLGFLMGSRKYEASQQWFSPNQTLRVICEEGAIVGTTLATFNCTIHLAQADQLAQAGESAEAGKVLATASLSVYRQPLEKNS